MFYIIEYQDMQSRDSCVQREKKKLQHYATAYRNHKRAGEKLCLVSNLYFSSKPG